MNGRLHLAYSVFLCYKNPRDESTFLKWAGFFAHFFVLKMDRAALVERIKEVVEPMLRSFGVELVEVEYAGSGRSGLLRVFIDKLDKKEGVTLDDCERVSRSLGPVLEIEDLIPHRYTLEVSSPGLDRPLKKKEDFQRSLGKMVRLKTAIPREGQKVFVGRMADFQGDEVILQGEKGKEYRIPFVEITQARLEVEF